MIISNNKLAFLFVLVCLGSFLTNPFLCAQNLMELHKGTVKLIRNDASRLLKTPGKKIPLFSSDRLQTGVNTSVSLYLKGNNNTIKLFSNSFFKLEEVTNDGENVALLAGKGNFNVKPISDTENDGVIRDSVISKDKEKNSVIKFGGEFKKLSKNKNLLRKKRFSIRTVSALVGVRGTEFVVGTSDESTKVLGLSGEVTLASPEVPDYEVPILANQASHVNEGSGPSVPVTIPSAESEKIVSGEGVESFKEVKFGPSELISSIQQRLKNDDQTPRFEEEQSDAGRLLDQLDRLEELESIVENAENAIFSSAQKILILSMTFTDR